jgi:hypothetical protein
MGRWGVGRDALHRIAGRFVDVLALKIRSDAVWLFAPADVCLDGLLLLDLAVLLSLFLFIFAVFLWGYTLRKREKRSFR